MMFEEESTCQVSKLRKKISARWFLMKYDSTSSNILLIKWYMGCKEINFHTPFSCFMSTIDITGSYLSFLCETNYLLSNPFNPILIFSFPGDSVSNLHIISLKSDVLLMSLQLPAIRYVVSSYWCHILPNTTKILWHHWIWCLIPSLYPYAYHVICISFVAESLLYVGLDLYQLVNWSTGELIIQYIGWGYLGCGYTKIAKQNYHSAD